MAYQAFISYSHAADGKLSPAIQSALHHFAKGWYQLRAIRVFRDKTNLSVNPGLWGAIEQALSSSEYFLLLASPRAAQSPWVQREVEWWMAHKSVEKLLIVLTDGDLAWDSRCGDFDWNSTSALPRILRGQFKEEPLYIDLRWAGTADHLSLRHTQFRAAILDIAATIRGIPKDELDGEDVRQHRRTRWIASAAVAVILVFAIVAVWQAYVANSRRQEAERQALIARSRELAVSAMSQLSVDPELSLLLAVEAGQVMHTPEAEEALRQALIESHLRAVLRGPDVEVSGAAFSPDNRRLATVSWDGTARVWDVASAQVLFTVPAGVSIVNSVVYSSDGRFFVTESNMSKVDIWDAETGNRIAQIANSSHPSLSPDGKFLVTLSLKTASIWELDSGQKVSTLTGHSEFINDAAFSPDGRFVVTAGKDRTACVWDAATGRLINKLSGHDGEVVSARFSPHGTIVVTAAGKVARLWKPETGALLRELTGTGGLVRRVEFAPQKDARLMVVEGDFTRIWDLAVDERLFDLRGTYVFSPDGEFLASTQGVWTATTGARVSRFYGPLRDRAISVAFSLDGRTAATTYDDGSARIWAAGTQAAEADLRMGRPERHAGLTGIAATAVNRDGTRIGAVSRDGRAAVWSRVGGQPLWEVRAHDTPIDMAFSLDGRWVATTGKDNLAKVWNGENGRAVAVMQGHTGWVNTVSFSPDGKQLLTGGYDLTARLWASDTGENRFVLGGHRSGIYCAVFSPDGKAVATCDEEVARLWDASSGKLVRELTGHTGTVTDAVFSPTGSFLVTATGGPTGDSSARIWEVASGRLLSTVNQVQGATFGSEDRLLLTVDTNKLARIRDWQSDVVLAEFVMDSSAQWSPDGRFALIQAVQDELQLRNAITGKLLMNLSNLPLAAVKPVFSRDGQLIVVGGIDPHARLDGSTDFNLVRIHACDVCAPFDRLLALARQRLTRTLSLAERQIYLHERTSPP